MARLAIDPPATLPLLAESGSDYVRMFGGQHNIQDIATYKTVLRSFMKEEFEIVESIRESHRGRTVQLQSHLAYLLAPSLLIDRKEEDMHLFRLAWIKQATILLASLFTYDELCTLRQVGMHFTLEEPFTSAKNIIGYLTNTSRCSPGEQYYQQGAGIIRAVVRYGFLVLGPENPVNQETYSPREAIRRMRAENVSLVGEVEKKVLASFL